MCFAFSSFAVVVIGLLCLCNQFVFILLPFCNHMIRTLRRFVKPFFKKIDDIAPYRNILMLILLIVYKIAGL